MSCDYCWPGNCCGGPNCLSDTPKPPFDLVHVIEYCKDICGSGEDWHDFVDWPRILLETDRVLVDGVIHKINEYGFVN